MKKLSELTLVFLAISLVFSGCMDVKTPTAPPDIHLLSLNKPMVVSAEENSYPNINLGPYADDGNLSTRWCSLPVYPAWIYIDLQTNHLITGITLRWEACALGQYQAFRIYLITAAYIFTYFSPYMTILILLP
jgi:hypothetical protein